MKIISIMTSTHALIFLLALICIPNVSPSVDITQAKKDEEHSLMQAYSNMNNKFKNSLNENLKTVLGVLLDKSHEFNLSIQCRANSLKILMGIRDLKIWAVNFADAAGKLSDGFLMGNFHMYGNYDQCLNSSVLKRSGEVDFRGQYCSIIVKPLLPSPKLTPSDDQRLAYVERLSQNLSDTVKLYLYKSEIMKIKDDKFGLCVPSGCDQRDVKELFKYVGKQMQMNLTVEFCDTEDSLEYFHPIRIFFLCNYAFFILLLLVGSAIDQYSRVKTIKFENSIIRGLLCFSIITNFPKFMNTKETDSSLSCLNGVRVLSLFYVILGHHYLIKADSFMMKNSFMTFIQWIQQFFFQIVINGIYTVDVFFFIGGFLNCYIRAKRKFTYFSLPTAFMALVHRLFRIYPILIFSYILLFLLNIRGPLAHSASDKFTIPCLTQWWKNILFINNFYYGDDQCFQQTWYLCCDMQYFLVSLISIPLLFSKPKIGVLVNSAIIFISVLSTGIRVYVDDMPPTLIFSKQITEKSLRQLNMTFQSPFTHAASYFGGALLGYLLIRKKSFTIPKIVQLFGWIIAGTMFCTVLFMTKRWNTGTRWTRLGSSLYYSLSRPLYSWSVGWLIFCCLTGHGGVVNYLLSLKVWIPFNRLCLSMYLISPVLQFFFFSNLRTPIDNQAEIEIWIYFGEIAVTALVCLPFVLLFESPFIQLEKIIFSTKEKKNEAVKESEMKESEICSNENGIKSDKDINSIKI